jgi:hypothetical protein
MGKALCENSVEQYRRNLAYTTSTLPTEILELSCIGKTALGLRTGGDFKAGI